MDTTSFFVPVVNSQRIANVKSRFSNAGVYCKSCFTISSEFAAILSNSSLQPDETETVIAWNVRLDDLTATADGGCHFCGFMACRFFDDRSLTFTYSNKMESKYLSCCSEAASTEMTKYVSNATGSIRKFLTNHPDTDFTLIMQLIRPNASLSDDGQKLKFTAYSSSLASEDVKSLLGYRRHINLEFYALPGSHAYQWMDTRPIATRLSSERSLAQARKWIDNCLHNHESCPDLKKTRLPKRVVEILDDATLRLVTSEDEAAYATLSYCWGGPQSFATISSNVQENSAMFTRSSLPQTLQDAVQVTESLGLKYIWIDSLCIIQDSLTDKEEEIPKMSQYYSNSHVTICAAAAETCNDGFFKPRGECKQHPDSGIPRDLLKLPFLCPDGELDTIYFREENPYISALEPINRRAWTLQELLLSPRVLIYGGRLLWQCHTVQHSDGGVEDWSMDNLGKEHRRVSSVILRSKASPDEKQGPDQDTNADGVVKPSARTPDELFGVWHHAIEEFSCRRLTFPEDKLPAVAGLAVSFQELLDDEYLAGLWRGNLARELLWSTWPNLQLLKPAKWRAPTWSWASVDNKVAFNRTPSTDARNLTRIVNCSVTPRSAASAFGEVAAGVLEIEAPVLSFENEESINHTLLKEYMFPGPVGYDVNWHRRILESNQASMRQVTSPGSNEDWVRPQKPLLLLMFEEPANEDGDSEMAKDNARTMYCHGLVLEDKGSGEYERVANFTRFSIEVAMSRQEWETTKRSMTQTVKIV